MMKLSEYPQCNDERPCFAKKELDGMPGRCTVLNTTYPREKACPFCKTRDKHKPNIDIGSVILQKDAVELKEARAMMGLTQEQMADCLAISPNHYCKLECGYFRANPTIRYRLGKLMETFAAGGAA